MRAAREAGRKLDALVAEKVMAHGERPNVVPCYSTDIAAAWGVVVEMLAQGWSLTLVHEDFEHPWMAEFARGKMVAREGSTAPLAICLAAVATLEFGA